MYGAVKGHGWSSTGCCQGRTLAEDRHQGFGPFEAYGAYFKTSRSVSAHSPLQYTRLL